jgi:hypothetical protein
MNDPYENLEVAKLAAIMSGQLRRIDKETESSTPANRIDLRKFQQQVVNSANPNSSRPVDFGGYQNQDEARMLEFLNNEALNKVPELIPAPNYVPPQTNYIPTPQNNIPVVQNNPEPESIKQVQEVKPLKNSFESINNEELIVYIKSIDNSLKDLCSFFIKTDLKKNKKKQTLKKTKIKTTPTSTAQYLIPTISKERELELLREKNLYMKDIQNVE